MNKQDSAGYEASGATGASLDHFETATHELRCFYRDPLASVDAALAASPELVIGHVLRGYLHLLGTEPAALPVARQCWEAGLALPANEREQRHLQAVGQLVEGRWHDAGRTLEELSIAFPRDALALQAGHQVDFFTGNARMLRDRIARALPAWGANQPGYHAVLAMQAFGLEETADYAQAEHIGRRAVELEPHDGWAQHAVAHVMEMQGRQSEGIAWMRAAPQTWAEQSFFAVHNWWHTALFHLDLGEVDEVLALLDGAIDGHRSQVVLDMLDVSALLWRLHLRGVDVGERWQSIADRWAPFASAGNYAFNDLHAVLCFVGAGRSKAVDTVLAAQQQAMQAPGDNAAFTREVGHPACLAVKAFGDGNHAEAVRLLRAVRHIAHRFGGSHAQRDLIDLTLIEAAFRAGDAPLARALAAERAAMRPTSPLARSFVARAAQLS